VLSIPKSGTYLVAEILKGIGLTFDGHISTYNYVSPGELEDLRNDPDRFHKPLDFRKTIAEAQEDHFFVGHIPFSEHVVLQDWYKLFTHRELRNVVVSCARYYSHIKNPRHEDVETAIHFKSLPMGEEKVALWFQLWGHEYSSLVRAMMPWHTNASFCIEFETLTGQRGRKRQLELVENLCWFLGRPQDPILIDRAATTRTATSTGDHSDYRQVWTPHLETLYQQYGFML